MLTSAPGFAADPILNKVSLSAHSHSSQQVSHESPVLQQSVTLSQHVPVPVLLRVWSIVVMYQMFYK